MSRPKIDPRASVKYARMNELVDLLETYGPADIDFIVNQLGVSEQSFHIARSSMEGRMALADRGVVIPRPVAGEGYLYKISGGYRTGDVATNAEPNVLAALSDLATRLVTFVGDLDGIVDMLPPSTVRRMLKRAHKMIDVGTDQTVAAAQALGAPLSDRALHTIDA